ncbi:MULTISPECIES: hypothetical protein [unclassified Methanobrevibacter]|jgi:hypothetical protein|nr:MULTISPECIES: hypothetical protein [unclassified Methanobrevibacter]MEE0942994.1 hypothetical protein [Methanobrevibacter sp.]
MKDEKNSIKATIVLNKSNSDGFLEYPFDLKQVMEALDELSNE